MAQLARMTLGQLQNLPNFTIWNEHAKIEFQGETDLTDVDLEDIVTLKRGSAEVYNDEVNTTKKPPVG